jgi:hypothetical protein
LREEIEAVLPPEVVQRHKAMYEEATKGKA